MIVVMRGVGIMIIVGSIGLNGSGKDTVVGYIAKKYNMGLISIGDMVREIAERRGVEPTRNNLNRISEEYMKEFGVEYFPRKVCEKIRKTKWQRVAITGIRSKTDVTVLRKEFQKNFILIAVTTSDPWIRFQRLLKRGEPRDPKTYEEYRLQDANEENIFKLSETMKLADYDVDNDGSLNELFRKIDNIMEKILKV